MQRALCDGTTVPGLNLRDAVTNEKKSFEERGKREKRERDKKSEQEWGKGIGGSIQ